MNPTFLSRFTPSLMTPDVLEGIFVQRERLAKRTVALIRDSVVGPDKHHTLLIGPRGIGKTHFVALVYHRVQAMYEVRDKMVVAWLREEEWGVSSFLDLLIRILRALADAHPDGGLEGSISEIYEFEAREAERKATEVLEAFIADRTLFLIVENLDDLFQGLQEEGQQRFRAYLQNHHTWTILATSQSLFSGVSLQTSPFYGFFRIKHLKEFDVDEAAELLRKIANRAGQPDLASFIATPIGRARIRAVHHLAGGNPRIYVILSQFLTQSSLDDLVGAFLNAMDDLTPYYQSRMAWLSSQQRKIIDFLCDQGNAAPVKVIAQRCFISQQTASSQLKMLKDWGYVRSINSGRESHYELREPLMRLSLEVKRQRGEPVRLFVDFLRYWFSRHEMKHRLDATEAVSAIEKQYLTMALSIAESSDVDPHAAACSRDIRRHVDRGELSMALGVLDELIAVRGIAGDFAWRGELRTRVGLHELAQSDFSVAVDGEPGKEEYWAFLVLSMILQHHNQDARDVAEKAVKLHRESALLKAFYGFSLAGVGEHGAALRLYDEALSLHLEFPFVVLWKASSLLQMDNAPDALSLYLQVLSEDADNAAARIGAAQSFHVLENYREAIALLRAQIEADQNSPKPRLMLVRSLVAWGDLQEALKELDQALAAFFPLGGDDEGVFYELLRALLHHSPSQSRREFLRNVISMFASRGALAVLGVVAVTSIVELLRGKLLFSEFAEWVNEWKEMATNYSDLEMPLRMLDAAVEYSQSQDVRVLLRLPAEQRSLLEPLFEGEHEGVRLTVET